MSAAKFKKKKKKKKNIKKLTKIFSKLKRVNTKEVGEYCLVRIEIIMPNKTYHITLEKKTSIIRKFASGKEFI